MSRQDDLKKLIVNLQRRLQTPRAQPAPSKTHSPAQRSPEIEAVAKEIERLQAELVELSAAPLSEVIWPEPLPVSARQVFICYARQDIRFVQTLAADLERAGLAAWWDVSPLTGDEDWSHTIEAALKDSDDCLVVLSPDAVESDRVRYEYAQALGLGLNLVPVLYRKCEPPLPLTDQPTINFVNQSYPEALRGLLPLLGADTSHLPATMPPRPTRSRRRRWPWGGVALLLFVGIVAAGWGYVALFGSTGPEVVNTPAQSAEEPAVVLAEATSTPTQTPPPPPSDTPTNTPVPPTGTPEPPAATPTPPPTATPTVSTPTTTRTSTPSSSPVTATVTASTTARPSVTVTSTPTVRPTPRLAAPVLLAPAEGAVVQTGILTTFRWEWAGTLPADRYFEIRIWLPGQYKRGAFDAREVTTTRKSPNSIYEFTGDVISARGVTGSETYLWDVVIVSQDPYRVVGRQTTPRSINIIVASGSTP